MPSVTNDYQLGSIFWAKVGSHPWWPCMIYYAPNGDDYVKEKGRSVTYHVQFLGPLVERAWVSAVNLIPFEGKKAFDEYVEEKLRSCKDRSERVKYDSKSVSSSREFWTQSWKEAEEAMKLTLDERIEKFGRISVKLKSRRFDKAEEGQTLQVMSTIPLTVEEEAESLANFLKDEMGVRIEISPELDRKCLEEELRTLWPTLDIPTKRRYLQDQLSIFNDSLQRLEKTRKCKEVAASKALESAAKSAENRNSKSSRKSEVKKRQQQQTSEPQEFDVEIHRLIVSPAQYRLQPVCPVCEVYSVIPGEMSQCRGPCGRIVHIKCMKYKSPPPSDNNRPERFRCPQCLSGEFLCSICGKPDETGTKNGVGQLFACQVVNCGRHFHRECLSGWPGAMTRPESSSTRPGGFQILRCPAHTCNTCVLESNETNHHKTKRSTSNEGPFLECVRCPAVFHTGDLCTPAGSVEVSLSHIVCPRHFDDSLQLLPNFKTQHPNWCFHCFRPSGERIDCYYCPTTYHKDCLQPSFGTFTDDKFVCRSCRQGVFPRYAQIIWAKIARFRWWPCEIIHARNAPINILNMSHPEGSFPVHFLASEEYQWLNRGRVFPYEIGLQTPAAKDTHSSSKIEAAFSRSLHRAPKAHAIYVNHVLRRGLPLKSMHAEQLPENELLPLEAFNIRSKINLKGNTKEEDNQLASVLKSITLIKSNTYSNECLLKLEDIKTVYESLPVCSCKSSSKLGAGDDDNHDDGDDDEFYDNSNKVSCSTSHQCHHFLNKYECTSKICSFPDSVNCGNRRFAQLNSMSTDRHKNIFSVMRTVNRGYGLKSLMSFKKGDLVTEYTGEVIDVSEANRRILDALGGHNALSSITSSRKDFHPVSETYLARLSPRMDLILDAKNQGSLSRFINHACEPNLYAECWIVDGHPRLGLFANRPIKANEELTINYITNQFLSTGLMAFTSLCLCGADTCVSTPRLPTSFKLSSEEIVNGDDNNVGYNTPAAAASAVVVPQTPISTDKRKSIKKIDEADSFSPTKYELPEAELTATPIISAAVSLSTRRSRSHGGSRRYLSQIKPAGIAACVAATSVNRNNADQLSYLVGLGPPLSEDFCYRCGDGGQLVLCDKSSCSKAYHVRCLGLSVPPLGIWYCPWHYCDVCGKPSTHLCWRCPNSYCLKHADENCIQVDSIDKERWNSVKDNSLVFNVRWICSDHTGMQINGPQHRPVLISATAHTITTTTTTTFCSSINGDNNVDESNIKVRTKKSEIIENTVTPVTDEDNNKNNSQLQEQHGDRNHDGDDDSTPPLTCPIINNHNNKKEEEEEQGTMRRRTGRETMTTKK
uniref:Histone-lysine N-methyltransferase n=2 Tax=Trichobilharzia regenti TaxID=157069 RepID=A0AA85IMM0_TRIRE|nr:unnamed protein product [Trichobilharzia regenti]